jgi:hypothetical protein
VEQKGQSTLNAMEDLGQNKVLNRGFLEELKRGRMAV